MSRRKVKRISFKKFTEQYASEDVCRQALARYRWPDGFVCPVCGSKHCCKLSNGRYQCMECRRQTSVTAGTFLHRSHVSLVIWFQAFYLVTQDKRGISATQLAFMVGVNYKTAWLMLKKIRTAMLQRDASYMLNGVVEMDDAYFGSPTQGKKRGRGTEKSKFFVALSLDENSRPKYLKLAVTDNLRQKSVRSFAECSIEKGSKIESDGFRSYIPALSEFDHHYRKYDPESGMLKWLHTMIGNVKDVILGTYHGVPKKYLPLYFAEQCYRFNRRSFGAGLFDRLLVAMSAVPLADSYGYSERNIKGNVSLVGFIDWELETFHGDDYSILNGSSQNAYLIEEEKTVLVDTIWTPHRFDFVENLKKEIDLKQIDFIVANHGECDHSGALTALMAEIPDTPIYCSAAAVRSIEGQYGKRGWNFKVVKTGDSVDIGNGKQLVFVEMRMLHWPDSMATYLTGDNILFSNDAFGQHYAVEELFNDKADQNLLYREAVKYFANILNPFAGILTKKLAEITALNLPIEMIAPSHGAIWRDNPLQIVQKYAEWADAYQENQVTVAYDTMWEGTTKIAHKIAEEINRQSPDTVVKVFNVAKADKNEVMTEVFKSKAIAVGSPTVSNSILSSVAGWLEFLKQLKFKNKRAAAFGCYGWSGESVKILQEKLAEAGFDVVDEHIRSMWNPEEEDFALIPALVTSMLGGTGAEPAAEKENSEMTKYKCGPCGYVYDPAKGDLDNGIAPGTPFEDLPEDWCCPICSVGKDLFEPEG